MKKVLFLVAVMIACLVVPLLAEDNDASSSPTYTITFNPCNGEEPWVYETDHNGWLKDWHAVPEKSGCTFAYWDDGNGHHLSANEPWYAPYYEDTVFTAVYTINESGPSTGAFLAVVIMIVIFIMILCIIFLT